MFQEAKNPVITTILTSVLLARGIANSFGVFQAYYQTTALPYETPGNISWIGSLQVFLLMLGGLLAGPVFDMGYLRTLLFTGVFAICFAMFMVGLCSQYWQFVLAQGLVMGFGFGCLFLPTITIVAQYFTTKKAIAFGIATLGASIGKPGLSSSAGSC